jgi:hypothetical protein
VRRAVTPSNGETPELIEAVIDRFPLTRPDGAPTSAGRWLLAQADEDLVCGTGRTHISAGDGLAALVEFLRRWQPDRLDTVAPMIVAHPKGRIPEKLA